MFSDIRLTHSTIFPRKYFTPRSTSSTPDDCASQLPFKQESRCVMPSEKKDKMNPKPNCEVCSDSLAPGGGAGDSKLPTSCARCGQVFYCNKDWYRAQWRGYKQCCVPKSCGIPHHQEPVDILKGDCADSGAADTEQMCVICQDPLASAEACTLPCTHAFHSTCVVELRKLGVQQACPLCRTPLPAGPEKFFEEATRRYMVLHQMVERDDASWSALPKRAQKELDQVIAGWQVLAEEGHSEAQCNLGVMFLQGRGVAQNDMQAIHWFRMAAERGKANAQTNLGVMFKEGRGVAQNYVEAVRWYRMAANQGDVKAQYNLSVMFKGGQGVAQSDKEAVQWSRKATNQGDAEAQCFLGTMFMGGRGVAQSYAETARWYRMAADQGHALAQCFLGVMFMGGHGVAQSNAEAAQWFRKAAIQGHAQGQCYLGTMFMGGHGVAQSNAEAAKWYRKAAIQGHVEAQGKLGAIFLQEGCGVALSEKHVFH